MKRVSRIPIGSDRHISRRKVRWVVSGLGDIVNLFQKLGMQPKADNPQDFKAWIQDMASQQGPLIKEEPSASASTKPVVSDAKQQEQPTQAIA